MSNRPKSPVRIRRDRIVRIIEAVIIIILVGTVTLAWSLAVCGWIDGAQAAKDMTRVDANSRFVIQRGMSIGQPKGRHMAAYLSDGELNPAGRAVQTVHTEATVTKATNAPATTSLGWFKLTAYCACEKCCGEYANGYTATGTLATEGRTIAVDPSVIPYGTQVSINGHIYTAEDCGGGIKQNRIDIFFGSHDAALQFGVGEAEVFVVG